MEELKKVTKLQLHKLFGYNVKQSIVASRRFVNKTEVKNVL